MRYLSLLLLATTNLIATAQERDSLFAAQFVARLEMTGDVWACWDNQEVPWETGDVIPLWNYLRTPRTLRYSDLCEGTLSVSKLDTVILDVLLILRLT